MQKVPAGHPAIGWKAIGCMPQFLPTGVACTVNSSCMTWDLCIAHVWGPAEQLWPRADKPGDGVVEECLVPLSLSSGCLRLQPVASHGCISLIEYTVSFGRVASISLVYTVRVVFAVSPPPGPCLFLLGCFPSEMAVGWMIPSSAPPPHTHTPTPRVHIWMAHKLYTTTQGACGIRLSTVSSSERDNAVCFHGELCEVVTFRWCIAFSRV